MESFMTRSKVEVFIRVIPVPSIVPTRNILQTGYVIHLTTFGLIKHKG